MNKETIELERDSTHISGYARGFSLNPDYREYSTEDPFVLDALLEWSQQLDNLNKKVYRHKIRRVEENISDRVYKYFRFGEEVSKEIYDQLIPGMGIYKVHYCDLVYYLDIYWQ